MGLKFMVNVSKIPPVGFVSQGEVAGVWCRWKGKYLLLKRAAHKPQGESWGIPAGKLHEDEDPKAGALRELLEETGVELSDNQLSPVGSFYVEHPDLHFIFHIFFSKFDHEPELNIDMEAHTEAKWVTKEEALDLPLIGGGMALMDHLLEE